MQVQKELKTTEIIICFLWCNWWQITFWVRNESWASNKNICSTKMSSHWMQVQIKPTWFLDSTNSRDTWSGPNWIIADAWFCCFPIDSRCICYFWLGYQVNSPWYLQLGIYSEWSTVKWRYFCPLSRWEQAQKLDSSAFVWTLSCWHCQAVERSCSWMEQSD